MTADSGRPVRGMPEAPILRVENLKVFYRGAAKPAVDGVSFLVRAGECVAVVGESGSGKSTAAAAIGRLTDLAGARCEGHVWARSPGLPSGAKEGSPAGVPKERDVLGMDTQELREFRKNYAAYVFQEPASSLNPVMRVDAQFFEIFGRRDPERAARLLEAVKIADAKRAASSFPHELSGGMQQRAMIAMALAKDARLLIADEPTTALDATVQRDVLNLISDIRHSGGLAVLLVTHDLWAARETADRILVMRSGRIVEELARADYDRPVHPYTRALLAAALLDGVPQTPIPVTEIPQ